MVENRNRAADHMIYLSACALHRVKPDVHEVAEMDYETLYHAADFHSMTAIVCMGLEAGQAFDNDSMSAELAKKWKDARDKAIRKNILLDVERQKLLAFMEKSGIWYMPLKGIILKDLYPELGMRQMADNDILFDTAHRDTIQNYMRDQGFTQSIENNADVYHKPPVYNFEMHKVMFESDWFPDWSRYYENVKERLLKDEGNSYGYHFSDEDFYCYLMVHACKHHCEYGTGIRTLLDCYVYNWKKGESLDRDYIRQELQKLNVADFEEECRTLGEKLFHDAVMPDRSILTEQEQRELSRFAAAGTYGSLEVQVKDRLDALHQEGNVIDRRTKWKYYFSRLFPNMEWYRKYVPFCYRHRWAIPFFCVYRAVREVFCRRKKLKYEIKSMQEASSKNPKNQTQKN